MRGRADRKDGVRRMEQWTGHSGALAAAVVLLTVVLIGALAWLLWFVLRSRSQSEMLAQSQKRLRIINALSTAYAAIMLVNLKEHTVEVLKTTKGPQQNYKKAMSSQTQWNQIEKLAAEPYKKGVMEFCEMSTVPQRLKEHEILTHTWQMANGGWMLSVIIPQRYDSKGELIAVLVANRDVTEEKRHEAEIQHQLEKAADEARRANAAKTDFLRRMSHDVRTPINGIRGMVEISRHYAGDEAKQEECRQKILSASGFLLDLVNNVLDMNKLESGEIRLEQLPFDLKQLVEETVSVTEVQAQERGIRLVYSGVQGAHTGVIGSPVHVRQVLQNIASNAIKYTPEGGSVTLECCETLCTDGQVTYNFRCTDTGIGMSPEFQQKAFEPFAQEDSSARTAYSGTGLGLAITKELVEQMGGQITFTSQQGKGTVFVIGLPFRLDPDAKHRAQTEQTAQPAAASGVRGAKVLLVEDNDLNMEIANFLLENEGAIVTQAWNGQQALDIFAASAPGSFDVILMDVMMPVMGGLEATRRIRALPRPDAASIPIFAMTANAFQDDIERSRAAGMNEHLTKPLDAPQLMETIARYRR